MSQVDVRRKFDISDVPLFFLTTNFKNSVKDLKIVSLNWLIGIQITSIKRP